MVAPFSRLSDIPAPFACQGIDYGLFSVILLSWFRIPAFSGMVFEGVRYSSSSAAIPAQD
jgi:hypothetical protein